MIEDIDRGQLREIEKADPVRDRFYIAAQPHFLASQTKLDSGGVSLLNPDASATAS